MNELKTRTPIGRANCSMAKQTLDKPHFHHFFRHIYSNDLKLAKLNCFYYFLFSINNNITRTFVAKSRKKQRVKFHEPSLRQ